MLDWFISNWDNFTLENKQVVVINEIYNELDELIIVF